MKFVRSASIVKCSGKIKIVFVCLIGRRKQQIITTWSFQGLDINSKTVLLKQEQYSIPLLFRVWEKKLKCSYLNKTCTWFQDFNNELDKYNKIILFIIEYEIFQYLFDFKYRNFEINLFYICKVVDNGSKINFIDISYFNDMSDIIFYLVTIFTIEIIFKNRDIS